MTKMNSEEDKTEPMLSLSVSGTKKDLEKTDKYPLVLITFAITLAIGATSGNEVIVTQFLYSAFAKEILGNVSLHTTREPCGNGSGDNSDKIIDIQDKTSHMYLLLNVVTYGVGIFSNLLLGTYSHLLHRRVQLLMPTIGCTINCAILLNVILWNLNIYWLFLGFAVDGFCGSRIGVNLGALLYSTDVTPRNSKRTFGVALLQGVRGMMMATMKMTAGFLLNNDSFILSTGLILALLIIALLTMCVLPNRKPVRATNTPGSEQTKSAWRILASPFTSNDQQQRTTVILSMVAFFSYVTIYIGVDRIRPLYSMNFPFCMSAMTIGWLMFGLQFVTSTSVVVVIPLVYRCLTGLSFGILSLVFVMGSDFLFAYAETTLQAFMGIILSFGTGVPIALLRGETSRILDSDAQGPLFACFAILESIAFFVGPVIFLNVYRESLHVYRGLPFLVAFGTRVVPLVFLVWGHKTLLKHRRREDCKQIQEKD